MNDDTKVRPAVQQPGPGQTLAYFVLGEDTPLISERSDHHPAVIISARKISRDGAASFDVPAVRELLREVRQISIHDRDEALLPPRFEGVERAMLLLPSRVVAGDDTFDRCLSSAIFTALAALRRHGVGLRVEMFGARSVTVYADTGLAVGDLVTELNGPRQPWGTAPAPGPAAWPRRTLLDLVQDVHLAAVVAQEQLDPFVEAYLGSVQAPARSMLIIRTGYLDAEPWRAFLHENAEPGARIATFTEQPARFDIGNLSDPQRASWLSSLSRGGVQ